MKRRSMVFARGIGMLAAVMAMAGFGSAGLGSIGIGSALAADPFPTRPIRILVNTGPGGLVDVTTRLVAEKMRESLGQSVIVENRAGGDGLVGIAATKTAAPDGYTLLASAATIAIQPAVKLNPGYDLEKDFVGIGPMLRAPYMIVVGAREPDKTLAEFVTRAKKNPDKMSYASAGVGTGTHMAAAMYRPASTFSTSLTRAMVRQCPTSWPAG